MIAITVDGFALDQLHYKIRCAVVCGPAVEETSNIRMIEAGENLALILEAADDEARTLSRTYDFKRNLLAVLIVGAESEIHFSHSSRANQLHDLIRAYTPVQHGGRRPRWLRIREAHRYRRSQELGGSLLMGGKQRFHFAVQLRVDHGQPREMWRALARVHAQRFVYFVRDRLPTLRSHALVLPRISRCNQARATVQSRSAVADEMFNTSAVSAIDSPPKKRNSTIRLCRSLNCESRRSASSSKTTSTLLDWGRATASSKCSVCP